MLNKTIIALLGLGCCTLPGCMVGPDYERPAIETPDAYAEATEAETTPEEPLTAWWTTLDDPVLTSLIERSATENLNLQIAEARVREARAARGIAESALWPTLGLSASARRLQVAEPETPSTGSPISGGLSVGPQGITPSVTLRGQNGSVTQSFNNGQGVTSIQVSPGGGGFDRSSSLYQVGFDAAWELDVFGGNRRAIEAADANIEATEEFQRSVLVSLLAEVALNYVELRSAQARIAITEKNIDAQSETVRLTQERFRVGLSSELDAVRAEALLASTKSQIPALETQAATSIHRLSVLLGREPSALEEELAPRQALPTAPEQIPVGLPSGLLLRRPDIRQAERQLAVATANIGVAVADLFPRFSLTGGLTGQSSLIGSVLSGANQAWSIGPGVSVPLFQGGRIRANIAVQDARQEQAAIGYEQTILVALQEVEDSLVSYTQEQERRGLLERAVAANENSVRLANERYVRGLEGFLNVLQAQQQLFQSEDLLVLSNSFVLTDLISLYKALGGGWEVFESEAVSGEAVESRDSGEENVSVQ
ncbi:MAG: efflux transporter outer membrane subunit [Candidatus Hydrogenedentes bacterium]|nr:efflux transporter outer membrane subunit [Candidatus Hydrogenedentota bacterium]